MDLGARTHPWMMPPVAARNKPAWRGGLSADLTGYTTEWLCLQGDSPLASLRTMETWVYLHPFSDQFDPAVMPLLSLGDFEWALTAEELAWPNEAEYPDCFFYLPFRHENFVVSE